MTVYLYRKTHRRQPVRIGRFPLFCDLQGVIPSGWCIRCGSEVFTVGENLCQRCLNGKGEAKCEMY